MGLYGEGGERGAFRIGNMCTPVADACGCMAKSIQYCKVKKKKIIIIKKIFFTKKESGMTEVTEYIYFVCVCNGIT